MLALNTRQPDRIARHASIVMSVRPDNEEDPTRQLRFDEVWNEMLWCYSGVTHLTDIRKATV